MISSKMAAWILVIQFKVLVMAVALLSQIFEYNSFILLYILLDSLNLLVYFPRPDSGVGV